MSYVDDTFDVGAILKRVDDGVEAFDRVLAFAEELEKERDELREENKALLKTVTIYARKMRM